MPLSEMAIGRPTNDKPSLLCGAAHPPNSSTHLHSFLDMKYFSQSQLYSLSRSSSYASSHPQNHHLTPNIHSDNRSTASIPSTTTATPRRIFAFSHRRGLPYRIRGSHADSRASENKLILKSIQRLLSERDMSDPSHMAVVPVDSHVQKRKVKRRSKNGEEFDGLGVINVNGEMIDLKYLASAADTAFQSELNRMTERMVTEDQLLGFLSDLQGRWGSPRKRRKYVDATMFVKALPINWTVLLSLRPRVPRRSLYCRRFVSPTDVHFHSCKDVAFFLKSQVVTSSANPPEGRAMIQMGSDCQVDLESDPATGLKNIPVNGEGSSKSKSEEKRNLKTNCIWCHVEFIREPVDAETLASSSGFICTKCKEVVSCRFESALSKLSQHADN